MSHHANVRDHDRRAERGLSLFELTLILAAAALVTAALAPAVLRTIHQGRQDDAREEMLALHQAIVGSEADKTWGYVGDLGRVPYDLSELIQGTGLPLFAASSSSGVGYGWNGPYLNRGRDADDFKLDPWGNPYDIGQVGFGQLRSGGPNGVPDDGDDIVYPPNPLTVYGTLIVSVKGHAGELVSTDPDGCVVTLHYSEEGAAASVIDDTVPYSFENVHRGLHTVEVSCPRNDGAGIAAEVAVVTFKGGAQQATELHVDLGAAVSATTGSTESESETTTDDPGSRMSEQR